MEVGSGGQRNRQQPGVGRRHWRQISALRKPALATRAAADGLGREGEGGGVPAGAQEDGPGLGAKLSHDHLDRPALHLSSFHKALGPTPWGGQGPPSGGESHRISYTSHTHTPGQWLGLKGPAAGPAPSLDLFDKSGFWDTCGLRTGFVAKNQQPAKATTVLLIPLRILQGTGVLRALRPHLSMWPGRALLQRARGQGSGSAAHLPGGPLARDTLPAQPGPTSPWPCSGLPGTNAGGPAFHISSPPPLPAVAKLRQKNPSAPCELFHFHDFPGGRKPSG